MKSITKQQREEWTTCLWRTACLFDADYPNENNLYWEMFEFLSNLDEEN